MAIATADRGYVLHFAARHALSPGLRDGRPALCAEKEAGVDRCGWEPFFAALDAAGGWLLVDDEAPGSAKPAGAAEARGSRGHGHSLSGDLASARRFLDAIRRKE